jgi:uncharacterized protein YjiS (DUF1127 family)
MERKMTVESRYFDLLAPQAPDRFESRPDGMSLQARALRAVAWPLNVWALQRERRALQRLDDHLLRDVGLTRGDVTSELAKWPWRL